MFYPFYINALNQYLDQVRMERYQTKSEEQYASQQVQLAEANRKLAETGIHFTTDPFEDNAGGRLSKEQYDKHVIGQVNIPKLALPSLMVRLFQLAGLEHTLSFLPIEDYQIVSCSRIYQN